MKVRKFLIGIPVTLSFLMIYTAAPLSSCNKKQVINDTTVIVIRDTTVRVIRDTTVITDTVYDLTDGLVAYYNFNGGNLNDSSGHGNNITFNNAAPAADRFGRAGNAYAFDGATSYMQVPNSPSLNPEDGITLMAIFKVNGYFSGLWLANQILGKSNSGDAENGFYCLRFTDFINNAGVGTPDPSKEPFHGAYGPQPNNVGVIAYDGSTAQIGQWYNLVYSFDGFMSKIYINGTIIDSNSNANPGFSPNSDPLTIGKDGTSSPDLGYYFNGIIDEIRIYNRALSTKEVAVLNKVQE